MRVKGYAIDSDKRQAHISLMRSGKFCYNRSIFITRHFARYTSSLKSFSFVRIDASAPTKASIV